MVFATALRTFAFLTCGAEGSRIRASTLIKLSHTQDEWLWNATKVSDVRQEKVGNILEEITDGCKHWTALFWPQVSFLTQEVRRRANALPEEPTHQQQSDLRTFTTKMSYLMCADTLDPRQQSSTKYFAQRVLPLWEELASAPASSLEVPALNLWFKQRRFRMRVVSGCLMWTQTLMCDLGFAAEELSGGKSSNATCWSKLQRPSNYRTFADISKYDIEAMDSDPLGYTKCQEGILSKHRVEQLCPWHGHYASGTFGQENWGEAPPKDSAEYADVIKCNKKFGIPSHEYPSKEGGLAQLPRVPNDMF